MKWDITRPFRIQRANTGKPLEDGYFACLRIVLDEQRALASDPRLAWEQSIGNTDSVVACLCDFIKQESHRIEDCEKFVRTSYQGVSEEQLLHPVFALIDFPSFDMGRLKISFAGSVWSENELRFWSRSSYLHK